MVDNEKWTTIGSRVFTSTHTNIGKDEKMRVTIRTNMATPKILAEEICHLVLKYHAQGHPFSVDVERID